MPRYLGQPDYAHGTPEKLGVLLMNLGTPEAPTPAAVRRYLAEFLRDPRVVEAPRWLWWLALHGVILRVRPRRSAANYRRIWTETGSPLLVHSRAQAAALESELGKRLHGPVALALGMRYGNPPITEALRLLRADNVRRLLVLPLYPQYSATTTASAFDAVSGELQRWRWLPELRFVNDYAAAPGYISALANSIREHWEQHGRGDKLLLSFHGLPQRYLLHGDPYHCQCHKTARLLADALQLQEHEWQVSFQSRVGREEWLRPYTDDTVRELAQTGIRKLDVACPGFAADCLETLEEIVLRNGEWFRAHGGEALRYIPALNARDDHIRFLGDLVMHHAQGWPETSSLWNKRKVLADAETAQRLARKLGGK